MLHGKLTREEWQKALEEAYKRDPYYQEERDGCPLCGGALHYDKNGDPLPCGEEEEE